jgi:hypothetical protein
MSANGHQHPGAFHRRLHTVQPVYASDAGRWRGGLHGTPGLTCKLGSNL